VVFKDGKGGDWYRLSPLDWNDSLTVLSVRDDKTKAAIVDKIYWTKNWREVYLRPRNQPRNKRIYVDKIDLKPVVKKLGTGTGKAELPKKPDTGNPFFNIPNQPTSLIECTKRKSVSAAGWLHYRDYPK